MVAIQIILLVCTEPVDSLTVFICLKGSPEVWIRKCVLWETWLQWWTKPVGVLGEGFLSGSKQNILLQYFCSVLKVYFVKTGSVFYNYSWQFVWILSLQIQVLWTLRKTNIQEVNLILRWDKVIPLLHSWWKHRLVFLNKGNFQCKFLIYLTSA